MHCRVKSVDDFLSGVFLEEGSEVRNYSLKLLGDADEGLDSG